LSIDVIDTGVGIESDKLKDLFSVFTKILEDRELNKQGCGLGLSISKKLSIVLGGDIKVTSEKGIGSTFTLTISNMEK
jgi:signal transduction histidine kinase